MQIVNLSSASIDHFSSNEFLNSLPKLIFVWIEHVTTAMKTTEPLEKEVEVAISVYFIFQFFSIYEQNTQLPAAHWDNSIYPRPCVKVDDGVA